MGVKLREPILDYLEKAGYFSLWANSTSDQSHNWLTVVMRYCHPMSLPIEWFLTFLQLENHNGGEMSKMVP